jgi:hypothetical protein
MKKAMIAITCMLGLASVVTIAGAATTIDLAYGDGYYVGSIIDGNPPSLELSFINNLIGVEKGQILDKTSEGGEYYSRVDSKISKSSLPILELNAYQEKDETGSITWDVPLSFNYPFYILGKYDAGNAGSLVWFIDSDQAGNSFTLPAEWNGHDLSHFTIYSNVPLPASLILFGSGLVGLAGIARRKLRA